MRNHQFRLENSLIRVEAPDSYQYQTMNQNSVEEVAQKLSMMKPLIVN